MSTAERETGKSTTRRSPGRPRVPFDRIIATALAIADEEGPSALTMRSLAQRLDTSTAVLYRAVADRAELVAHVVDRVFGEIVLDESISDDDWQSACIDATEAMFDAMSRHRGIAPLLIEQIPVGPNALDLREHFLSVLLGNGFPPAAAARSYTILARYTLGFAAQLRTEDPTEEAEAASLSALYHHLDPVRFPATVAVADTLPSQTLAEEFRHGLRLLVAGLAPLREAGSTV
ncbi:TetR/AcrR family transcriptional regulator [Nocardia brasiliensis]|uniref:TetR/AcrR family transcriptional regulator n=1 Tax=Nocardia brasiliensis TaxID=37326 RepID=UPI00189392FD|nr:TetR/AcrR family transcriptional regulator [Nocardia brasiliensis]MBF6129813.1 TetR/AcrR family transcriptional regulator [Nocardia brasiliensis]